MDKKQMLGIYEMMNRIRCFEEKAYSLFESNKLRGSVHLCTGEEAIPATVCSYLTDEDYITSTHRGHGDCLAKGAESKYALAELMGKATGYCKGRGGSMHIADLAKGNLGANAIVGGGIPHAVGAALALQMQGKKKNVAISFFGDSASNEGVTHEAMNLAAVWKVPCIFVCANNGFGISVPYAQSTSVKHVSERGAAYGIPSVTVDGNDVMAVAEAFETALKKVYCNGTGIGKLGKKKKTQSYVSENIFLTTKRLPQKSLTQSKRLWLKNLTKQKNLLLKVLNPILLMS